MKKFVIGVEGRNFRLRSDSGETSSVELFGFFTTRWVAAQTQSEAERHTLEIVRAELTGHSISIGDGDAEIWIEEVDEVFDFDPEVSPPGSGFTWYPEDSIDQN